MKDKAFARKVNRDDIVNGAALWAWIWTSTFLFALRLCGELLRSWA